MATRQTFGHTWWGQAWISALEDSAGLDTGRLSRGRTYARKGSVGTITVGPGYASASVQGSHGHVYRTDVGVKTLAASEWEQVPPGKLAETKATSGGSVSISERPWAKLGPLFLIVSV